jgi:PAS domain S-box-containing protein
VSLRAKLLLGLGLILAFLMVVSFLAYRSVAINRAAAAWIDHTEEVLRLANQSRFTIDEIELRYLQFLMTGSADALTAYQANVDRANQQLTQLGELTSDNPPQVARWQGIRTQLDRVRAEILEPAISIRGRALAGDAEADELAQLDAFAADQRAFAAVRASFAVALDVERQLLTQRTAAADRALLSLEQHMLWGTALTTIVGLVVALLLSQNIVRAMERFAHAAQAIAAGNFHERINLRRADEIGRAAAAFDSMAAALERDVSRLAALQHQTETILNSTAEGIYAIDSHGVCTIVNPSTARMTGYTVAELRGSMIHGLIHHTRADGTPYPFEECPGGSAVRDGIAREMCDELFWRKDGSSFPVEYSAVPIRDNNTVVGVVLSFRDVTERRQIERMKDEFISVVSHELRTPLTSIRGSLGLLAAGLLGPISERATRMVEVAVSNTDRLIRLINDILDIERIETGHAPMDKHWTDARDLVLRSVESIRSMADAAQLRVLADAEPILLRADPDRLQQTLTNLLGNAIKFSPPGSSIDVRARRQDGQAVISVRDRGRGIPADKLEAIFSRFEQVDASDAREKGGSGLGLAIARSIVEQHGGRIWAESTLGQGSTFFFTIPISERASLAVPHGSPDQPRILICDDDPDALEVVAEMLARHGFHPLTAATGEQALALAARETPDAILLDLAMPGMSGWDTLLALKERPETRDIPVVILSGLERQSNEPPGGHEGWIAKPVTPESLRRMLDHVLARRSGPARILLVEDDLSLATLLSDTFRQHGIETHHAANGEAAIAISQEIEPDLLLLDLGLPSGTGFEVIEWFRQHDRLRHVAVAVYTARELGLDPATPSSARLSPSELRHRVLTLLERVLPAA